MEQSNASGEPLPEAGAPQARTLEGVGSTALIMIEASSKHTPVVC